MCVCFDKNSMYCFSSVELIYTFVWANFTCCAYSGNKLIHTGEYTIFHFETQYVLHSTTGIPLKRGKRFL